MGLAQDTVVGALLRVTGTDVGLHAAIQIYL